jgi:uncharacterized glyoxalase superfamily protein PhnB
VRHLEATAQVARPDGRPIHVLTHPVHFEATPTSIRSGPPLSGQHTDEVLDGDPTDPWLSATPRGRGEPPAGYHSVTPRLVVSDVVAQIEFLRRAFGAEGDAEPGRPAEVRVGESLILVSGAGDRDLFPGFLYIYVADADESYRRAIDSGATSMESPRDTPYGDRRGMVRDPFGNVYQIAHRLAASTT